MAEDNYDLANEAGSKTFWRSFVRRVQGTIDLDVNIKLTESSDRYAAINVATPHILSSILLQQSFAHASSAEKARLRRQFAEAAKALDEGAALTQRQTEAFETERARLHDARLMVDYEAARAVEVDHRFEDAIVLYTALIEASGQGYFQDALARRDTLVDLVAKAESAYARSQTTADAAQKLQLLEQVLIVYPEFRDAASQADALRAQLAKP